MLNEIFELYRSMQAAEVPTESWHKDYETCPKYRTFRLLISDDGHIVDLEPITDIENIKALRKWEVSNGTSFPAFNVAPVVEAATEKAKGDANTLKKMLIQGHAEERTRIIVDDLMAICNQLWDGSEIERINRCLKSHPENLKAILGDVPEDLKAIKELIRRAALLDAQKLQTDIKSIVIRHVVQSPAGARDWVDSLLVTSAKNAKRVSLVLELADWSPQFKYPANHGKVQIWINSRLMAHSTEKSTSSTAPTRDAFGAPLSAGDLRQKFPDVRLPKLGSVKLRAMSSESPCQARYGHIDSESFPAGSSIRQEMKDSLEWLGHPSRRGKTWEDVSGACGFTKREGRRAPIPAILLAYPSVLPDSPPELAGAFGGGEQSGDPEGVRFESCAKRVTASLNLAVKQHPETEIRVLVLAKADKARTKLLLSKRYGAKPIQKNRRSPGKNTTRQ